MKSKTAVIIQYLDSDFDADQWCLSAATTTVCGPVGERLLYSGKK
jgi:hypothetical protein